MHSFGAIKGVATCLRCGVKLYSKFTAECVNKMILKIGEYIAKIGT